MSQQVCNGWQPVETAPAGKRVLMYGPSAINEDGEITNWKMEIGYLFVFTNGETQIYWRG